MAITPTDDYFHERPDNPYWNEAGWFSFMAAERGPRRLRLPVPPSEHRLHRRRGVHGTRAAAKTTTCLLYDWGEPYAMTNRFGVCLPVGPHASVISASNIAAITAIPA